MSRQLAIDGTVVWQTEPGFGMPKGGTCTGYIKAVSAQVGFIFVATDHPVPCVIGRGSDMEWHTNTDRVYLPINSSFQYTPPAPWTPPTQRNA